MGKIDYISDSDFNDKVLQSDVPVLVDFFADWCAPCKMMEPWVEQVAEEFVGKLQVYKVNVDENPLAAASYQVMSIPTLLIFKNGAPATSIVGAVPYKTLVEKINSVLEEV